MDKRNSSDIRKNLARIQADYEQIAATQISWLEAGYSSDELVSACKNTMADSTALHLNLNELLSKWLFPVLEKITEITDEDEQELFNAAQNFSSFEKKHDPGLALKIYKALYKRASKRKDDAKIIMYSYWCGITLFFFFRKQEEDILNYFSQGAAYADRYYTFEDPEIRKYIHRCLGNTGMMYSGRDESDKAYRLEEENFSFWNSILFAGKDLDFPWVNYFLNGLTHRHNRLIKGLHSEPDKVEKSVLRELLDTTISQNKLYNRNRELFSVFGGTRYDYHLWEAQFVNGLISFDHLLELVDSKKAEFKDDDYSLDAMYAKIHLPTLMMFYATKMERLQDKRAEIVEKVSHEIIDYFMAVPTVLSANELSSNVTVVAEQFNEIFKPAEQVDFILKMTIYRSIPLYAHSIMAGKIATFLTELLISQNPACFIGCLGITDETEVKKRADELTSLAEISGLCHDVGKNSYISNPYMHIRNPTEEETDVIKEHPDAGAALLLRNDKNAFHEALIDIIKGHHKYHDNAGGYPDDYDINASPCKIIVGIIAVANKIDRATDDIGNTHLYIKSTEDVCKEIVSRASTRFSPETAAVLDNKQTVKELCSFIDTERRKAYYTAYLQAGKGSKVGI